MEFKIRNRTVEIIYSWIPYVPATRWEPPEGGYADNIEIFYKHEVTGKEYKINYDMLSEYWQNKIQESIAKWRQV